MKPKGRFFNLFRVLYYLDISTKVSFIDVKIYFVIVGRATSTSDTGRGTTGKINGSHGIINNLITT